MKITQPHYSPANGKYFGPWPIQAGVLEYIGPLEHYLHKTVDGDYEIYKTNPILNDWNELQFYGDGSMIRKYKLILISYDNRVSWKSLID